jgi:hypothetical protein
MITTNPPTRRSEPTPIRAAGYAAAAAVNLVLLVIANSLLDWGWPPFLTGEFAEVLPLLNISIGAAALANGLYIVDDRPRFKHAAQLILGAVSLTVLARVWETFPFDFSAYTGFDWDLATRMVLVLAMIGTGIGMLVDFIKWLTARD